MSKVLVVLLGVGVVLCLFGVVGCGTVISFNNDCVVQEAGIKAQYKQNQNNYANYFNKIKEMAQVPDMYSDDLKKVYDGAMKGRYGQDGSKAVFQFIQEHNPQFDSTMYVKLQQAMESGRDGFEADQKMLLDKKRIYETKLGMFPGNILASILGFPKIDLDQYDIVINEETEKAFQTKRAGPLELRPAGSAAP